ncbi:FecR family protein [Devosia sp. A16]|uniref:FecR family protein n=1 Tax=Devosia sp. A16 TaxID=1736675 RepID=UPI0006D83ABB|nr:FecR family protein [Devosia sp. A16]
MHKMIWRAPLACALVALGFLHFSGSVLAASGKALGVKPAAAVETKSDTKTLTVGADVFIGDRVVTGADGQVQIKFSDQTELVVGPNSALLIEDYLLRNDDSAGKFAINALSGTFRFTTGRAPKDRYIIKTPTGTIGVRGTSFDFNSSNEETRVLLYHGQVILCNLDKTCVTLDDTCELGAYDLGRSEILGHTDDVKGAAREELKASFRYAQSQAPLLGAFRVEEAKECFHKGFVADTPRSLLDANTDSGPAPVEEPPPECECFDQYCCD